MMNNAINKKHIYLKKRKKKIKVVVLLSYNCVSWTWPFISHWLCDVSASITLTVMCVLSLADINRAIELLDKLQRTGEVPPQKLQALQRVLQSEFCNAVREVRHFLLDDINMISPSCLKV